MYQTATIASKQLIIKTSMQTITHVVYYRETALIYILLDYLIAANCPGSTRLVKEILR